MAYGIKIEGLKEAQKLLGADFDAALSSATQAIALEVQGRIAPYPPATEANSPGNATGRWYERGYGPRWVRKDGSIAGRQTSQFLGRQWSIRRLGRIGQAVNNRATYAPYLHSAEKQARWAGQRRWRTDREVAEEVVRSGLVKRLVVRAIVGAMRRRAA